MQVHTILTKKCRFGISKWSFGKLPSGWLAAIGPRDKKIFFKSLDQMDACAQKFINDYNYKQQSKELVRQLSLAI